MNGDTLDKKIRRFTIFISSGSLPDLLYLVGLGSDSPSYCRDLAMQADRDTDGSEYDKRVEAKDTLGRPLWAKGAIVLVGSAESRRLHTALEACSIVLDYRYVVVAEESARRVFVSMASMAEQAVSSRDICRRKAFVNKMRSINIDPDNIAAHEEWAVYKRHEISQESRQRGEIPQDAVIEAHLRVKMHEYMKAGSVPWNFCFGSTKPKEERPGTAQAPSGDATEHAGPDRMRLSWLAALHGPSSYAATALPGAGLDSPLGRAIAEIALADAIADTTSASSYAVCR